MPKIGVLGGTSLLESSLFSHLIARTIDTEYGAAIVYATPSVSDAGPPAANGSTDAAEVFFVQRHHADAAAGASVYRPPHLINHRANLRALSSLNVDVILAICSVGSLTPALPPGTLVLPHDYFALFCPPYSAFDDARGHFVPGFDAGVRAAVRDAIAAAEPRVEGFVRGGAVYAQTTGPRFETPTEIRFLAGAADIVGMTAVNEANVAKELDIPYAAVAMVDNMANGLGEEKLTVEEFKANVKRNQATVERAVSVALDCLKAFKR